MKRRVALLGLAAATSFGVACIDFDKDVSDFCATTGRCGGDGGAVGGGGGSTGTGGGGGSAGGTATGGGMTGGGGGDGGTAGGAGTGGGMANTCQAEVCHVQSYVLPHVLVSAAAIAPNEFWLVGGPGVIYRYDGGAFGRTASPATSRLYAVAGTSPSDVWVGGFDSPDFFHYNGTSFIVTPYDGGQSQTTAAYARTPFDAYLIDGHALWAWDGGGTWEKVFDTNGSSYLDDIDSAPGANVYLADDAIVWEWDGTNANPVTLPIGSEEVYSLDVTAQGYVWAVGTSSAVARRDLDGGWQKLTVNVPPFQNVNLWGVYGISYNEAWMAGDEGALLHYRSDAGFTVFNTLPLDGGNDDVIWFDLAGEGKDLWLSGAKTFLGSGNYDAGVACHLRLGGP